MKLIKKIKEKISDTIKTFFGTKEYSIEQVKINKWIIIDNKVLDVSSFLHKHPGGVKNLKNYFGKDASDIFHKIHKKHTHLYMRKFVVGKLKNEESESYIII